MNETERTMEHDPGGAGAAVDSVESFDNAEGFDTTLEDILPNVMKRFCPECGEPVARNATGRPRKFCSTECCNAWWRKHPKPEHWASAQLKVCPMCGKEFLSGREVYRPRTYCSHACANRARKGGGSHE